MEKQAFVTNCFANCFENWYNNWTTEQKNLNLWTWNVGSGWSWCKDQSVMGTKTTKIDHKRIGLSVNPKHKLKESK